MACNKTVDHLLFVKVPAVHKKVLNQPHEMPIFYKIWKVVRFKTIPTIRNNSVHHESDPRQFDPRNNDPRINPINGNQPQQQRLSPRDQDPRNQRSGHRRTESDGSMALEMQNVNARQPPRQQQQQQGGGGGYTSSGEESMHSRRVSWSFLFVDCVDCEGVFDIHFQPGFFCRIYISSSLNVLPFVPHRTKTHANNNRMADTTMAEEVHRDRRCLPKIIVSRCRIQVCFDCVSVSGWTFDALLSGWLGIFQSPCHFLDFLCKSCCLSTKAHPVPFFFSLLISLFFQLNKKPWSGTASSKSRGSTTTCCTRSSSPRSWTGRIRRGCRVSRIIRWGWGWVRWLCDFADLCFVFAFVTVDLEFNVAHKLNIGLVCVFYQIDEQFLIFWFPSQPPPIQVNNHQQGMNNQDSRFSPPNQAQPNRANGNQQNMTPRERLEARYNSSIQNQNQNNQSQYTQQSVAEPLPLPQQASTSNRAALEARYNQQNQQNNQQQQGQNRISPNSINQNQQQQQQQQHQQNGGMTQLELQVRVIVVVFARLVFKYWWGMGCLQKIWNCAKLCCLKFFPIIFSASFIFYFSDYLFSQEQEDMRYAQELAREMGYDIPVPSNNNNQNSQNQNQYNPQQQQNQQNQQQYEDHQMFLDSAENSPQRQTQRDSQPPRPDTHLADPRLNQLQPLQNQAQNNRASARLQPPVVEGASQRNSSDSHGSHHHHQHNSHGKSVWIVMIVESTIYSVINTDGFGSFCLKNILIQLVFISDDYEAHSPVEHHEPHHEHHESDAARASKGHSKQWLMHQARASHAHAPHFDHKWVVCGYFLIFWCCV